MLIFWREAEEVDKCLRNSLAVEYCEGALAAFTSLETLVSWRWSEYRIRPLVHGGSRGVTGMSYEHQVIKVFDGQESYAYHRDIIKTSPASLLL